MRVIQVRDRRKRIRLENKRWRTSLGERRSTESTGKRLVK